MKNILLIAICALLLSAAFFVEKVVGLDENVEVLFDSYSARSQDVGFKDFSDHFKKLHSSDKKSFQFFAEEKVEEVLLYALTSEDISLKRNAVLYWRAYVDHWGIPVLAEYVRASDPWNFQRGEEVAIAKMSRDKVVKLLESKAKIKVDFDLDDEKKREEFLTNCLSVSNR